jgi:hypothetical protein
MFWFVLGAVLLLALAAAIYHRKRSGTHVRNSQQCQPWGNVKAADHPQKTAYPWGPGGL